MPLCPERCPDLDVEEEELPSLRWSCWSENHLAVLAVPGWGVQYCTALCLNDVVKEVLRVLLHDTVDEADQASS